MPRRNRVDPWGDLHAVSARGLFTGNRGCVVDDRENVVRHHGSSLWIICQTEYKNWRWPLARPKRWTPLFFLDDAVALAAGHRPCGLCRRDAYRQYRDAVSSALNVKTKLKASDLNKRLVDERLSQGRGLVRAQDRILWHSDLSTLPDGAIYLCKANRPRLWFKQRSFHFTFNGWIADNIERELSEQVQVLTPPTSVAALRYGYHPIIHASALVTIRSKA